MALSRAQYRRSLLLAVPIFGLTLFLLYRLERRANEPGGAPPQVTSPDEGIAGLAGSTELAQGGELVVRLAPLHPDPARQAFDAKALRERLALGPGEPWRATLELVAAADAAPLALAGALAVTDSAGVALATLPAPQPLAGTPLDPLHALLAPAAGPLAPGAPLECVLWGRVPQGGARISGLVPGGAEIALAPQTFRRADLEEPLARLDARGEPMGPAQPGAGGADGSPRR